MRAFTSFLTAGALATGLSLGGAGSPDHRPGMVLAQTTVPQSGSAQGVNPPGSLPGGNTAFGASSTTSPTPLVGAPASGAAQGVTNPAAGVPQTGAVGTTTVR